MGERNIVVLVDEQGEPRGEAEKLDAHRPPGSLHLAFSVYLFSPDGTLLVQRRAASKYHFPGVWANACCSHPAPGEDLIVSARARLGEELGLDSLLSPAGTFVYRARCAHSGLIEWEFDHVFVGELVGEARPDLAEVDELRLVDPADVRDAGPAEGYAPWFATGLALAVQARA